MLIKAIDWAIDSFTSMEPLRQSSKGVRTSTQWSYLADSDLTTSFEVLRDLTNRARGDHTAARRAMSSLLISHETRDEDVDVRRITALGASKGRYIGNLRRLLPTISEPPRHIAELPRDEQLALVKAEVWDSFGNKVDGRFLVVEEGWSGRLIGMNAGTARRFAMLHCAYFREPLLFPARIKRMDLEPDAFRILTTEHWLVMLPDDAASEFLAAAEASKVEGVEMVSSASNHGCPDEDDRTSWSVLACPTRSRRYRDFRLAVQDAAVPYFDLSHWLRLLAGGGGRKVP